MSKQEMHANCHDPRNFRDETLKPPRKTITGLHLRDRVKSLAELPLNSIHLALCGALEADCANMPDQLTRGQDACAPEAPEFGGSVESVFSWQPEPNVSHPSFVSTVRGTLRDAKTLLTERGTLGDWFTGTDSRDVPK